MSGLAEAKTVQQDFKRRLVELGLLIEIKPPLAADAIPKDRRPIQVEGNSVSETLLRERR